MAREYVKTDTMRIKISGNPFNLGRDEDGLDLIEEGVKKKRPAPALYEGDFNELLESVYDAVMITEISGRIRRFNSRALEYFRYDKETFGKLNVLSVISGADEHTLKTIHDTLVNERRIFIEGYCLPRRKEPFAAEIAVSILHIDENELLCFFIRNVNVRVKTEEALREAQQELVDTAHHAGMAEIATGVLHDVGNILNSINVSCELILKGLDESALKSLLKVNEHISQMEDLARYISEDERGRKLPEIYQQLGNRMDGERQSIRKEAENLKSKIQIIKEVISTQQTYAKTGLYEEEVRLSVMIEDAVAILKNTIEKENIKICKEFEHIPSVRIQKSKFVHIVLNILKNACDALASITDHDRQITVEIDSDENFASVKISDNGLGIEPEAMENIFTHGFTTKSTGHGFGLHSCANLMAEMGGKIRVKSEGLGQGASFILTLPLAKKEESSGNPGN